MFELALPALELVINRYLNLDPDTITRLQQESGKIIEIEITDWSLTFFISPTASGLALYSTCAEKPNTKIAGTLSALFHVARKQGQTTELFNQKIEISGDTETGEKIREILQRIDIDWEEELSKVIGDIPANKIGNFTRSLKNATQHSLNTLRENIKEFLQFEINAVPTAREIESFCAEVTDLNNAVERAAARLKLLESHRSSR